MNEKNLNSFLKLGYFLDYQCSDFDFSGIDKEKYSVVSEQDLIEIGSKIWFNTIESKFEKNQSHLIPLSGGLDCRAILAAMLEFTHASNISTYTFGTPGTYDFEIGRKLAKKIGVKHVSYPLTEYMFSIEEELDFSKRSDCQNLVFLHPPITKLLKEFDGAKVWSGYGGDNIVGGHMSPKTFNTDAELKNEFVKKNTFVKSTNLTNISGNEIHSLISTQFINANDLTKWEQMDFNNRQRKYVEPHVLFKGFEYITPFIDTPWYDFMLSVDNVQRRDAMLYKKILMQTFPKIFNYPISGNLGLPMNASKSRLFARRLANRAKMEISKIHPFFVNPKTNYFDINEALRSKQDLKKLVRNCVMDLKLRKIVNWIDIDKIWRNHQNKSGNYADALLVLASLEIHLKNGKQI